MIYNMDYLNDAAHKIDISNPDSFIQKNIASGEIYTVPTPHRAKYIILVQTYGTAASYVLALFDVQKETIERYGKSNDGTYHHEYYDWTDYVKNLTDTGISIKNFTESGSGYVTALAFC